MRLVLSIFLISFATLLAAQTIDQKIEKLEAKGYLPKGLGPQLKQLIHMREDSVRESSILFYFNGGNFDFNSSGLFKEELNKMKNTTKQNPQKVLRDMVQVGLIENDSSVAWIKRELKRDSAVGLMRVTDIYNYLNTAGQYEDAVKLYNINALLEKLDSLQLLSAKDNKAITALAEKKKLNNLWDVFSKCNGIEVYNKEEAHDVVEGIRAQLTALTNKLPEIGVKNIDVVRKTISTVTDSIYITVQCATNTYYMKFTILSGNYEWKQTEEQRFYQILNKALTGVGSPKRIYEVSLPNEISGANLLKGLWPLTIPQHSQLQQFQRNKANTIQFFKFFPN